MESLNPYSIYDDLRQIITDETNHTAQYNAVCEEICKHFEGWTPLLQDLSATAQKCLSRWEEKEEEVMN